MTDPKLDLALAELVRLRNENPVVIDELIGWIKERPHTFEVTLRFHGHKLRCAEIRRVARGAA